MDFRTELEHLINRFSKENQSNTPDFILAEYLDDCLRAFDNASVRREHWYGHRHEPAGTVIPVDGPPPREETE